MARIKTQATAGVTLPPGVFHWQVLKQAEVADASLTELRSPGARPTSDHAHEQAYLHLVLEGRWIYGYGRTVESVEPWLVSFHPAHEVHRSGEGVGTARTFEIGLNDRWLDRLGETHRFDTTARCQCRTREAVAALMRLRREFDQLDRWSSLTVEGLILEATAALGRSAARPTRRVSPGWLPRLETMLRDDTAASMSLADVATWLGVHPSVISREFRRHHGCAPSEFVRRRRVERAARAIASTDDSLSTIALTNGFADQSHLTRVFRRYTGVTPGAYRRERGAA